MNPQNAVAPTQPRSDLVEFTPYGSADRIKLSVEIVRNLVAVPTRTGKLPADRDCLKFVAMCRSQKLNPFAGDAFLIGYDGKDGPQFSLITAQTAFLKRAETHPEFDGMESGIIVQSGDEGACEELVGDFFDGNRHTLVGGWATVHFKSRKHPMKRKVALRTYQKPFGQWQSDPAGMICKVAEVHALRDSFPSMLGGLYVEGEVNAIDIEARNVAPPSRGIQMHAEPQSIAPAQPPSAPPAEQPRPRRTRRAPDILPKEDHPPAEPAPAEPERNEAPPSAPQPAPAGQPEPPPDTPQRLLSVYVQQVGGTFDQFAEATEAIGCGHTVDGCATYEDMKRDACHFLMNDKRRSMTSALRTIMERDAQSKASPGGAQ